MWFGLLNTKNTLIRLFFGSSYADFINVFFQRKRLYETYDNNYLVC